ncbi:hypothetical protein CA13_67320 [Planctomycetes bacterium CA13]|uniref:Glycosyltransferase RgtA/B/C/D-like domain-containing protein n=1 Tax=Novipirellula herctigrandis TaxID=2527986 RepID=A0A5C5YN75_9BACT|nr:hypothetical protein CA13_67320 [Planctomycetes bacterium CA13]
MMHRDEQARDRRYGRYLVLILVGLAMAAGRIAVVTSREGDTAFLSANDRSRWATVASLVEDGSYEIDELIEIRGAKENRRPWYSIDMVRHRGNDGKLHYYSSKPPLLATVVAGVAKGVYFCTGLTLTKQPIYATRLILFFFNIPILALFFATSIANIERLTRSNWSRHCLSLGVIFGTMLFPFAMTLNNHLVAAAFTSLVVWIYMFASEKNDEHVGDVSVFVPKHWYGIAGFAAAFTAANELPALSMCVFWFFLFRWIDKRSVLPFIGGAAIVVIAFFGTNWIAHKSLRPAYAHRGVGAAIEELGTMPELPAIEAIADVLMSNKIISGGSKLELEESDEPSRWLVRSSDDQLFALIRNDSGRWSLSYWDDWYEYPGSYWKEGRRRGVDVGEPSRLVYLFNMLIGSYGIFSLTPMWFLVPGALYMGLFHGPHDYRRYSMAVIIASVVCLLFYLARPTIDRNYGGVSCCFRWVLWFTPLWIASIAPVVDHMAQTWRRRGIFIALLAFSVFSVSTALNTPWQSPWIYQFWSFLGWIGG